MKIETPRTDELDRKQTAHISGSSNDGAELLCDALQEMLEHARELETETVKLKKAMKAAKRLAAANYTNWNNAGGGKECEHGYNEGIQCPACDLAELNDALAEPANDEN